jgi:hypothetical protein
MPHRIVAVTTDVLEGDEPVKALSESARGEPVDVRVVAPAVEASPVRHTLGDIDEPREEAQQRLEKTLQNLSAAGIEARGEVGDPDPVQAAQDALLKEPADEILIYVYEEGQQHWYEGGLFDHAKESLEPPLRLAVLDGSGGDGAEKVVDVETAPAGIEDEVPHEVGGDYVPGMTRRDFAGMAFGIFGTIVAIILAAVATGGGHPTGWRGLAIGLAIAIALVNMANVIGVLLMESVRYRGGFAKMFRTLALVGTPVVVLINAGIVIFS